MSTTIQPDDRIEVERLGGFAGFGGPGARIRSRGQLPGSALDVAERRRLGALFDTPAATGPAGAADGFRYRLSLYRPGAAAPVIVELPEPAVPERVRDCVHDELA